MDLEMLRVAARNHPDKIMKPFDRIYLQGGFDGLVAVLEEFGGRSVYVPGLRRVLAGCIESDALELQKKNFVSIEALAKKYGYSGRHLMKIIKSVGSSG